MEQEQGTRGAGAGLAMASDSVHGGGQADREDRDRRQDEGEVRPVQPHDLPATDPRSLLVSATGRRPLGPR
jgi:hypothetical protein